MSVKYRNILGAIIAIYFFISGIVLIKCSAVIMGESLAEKLVLLIKDTTSGVFAGWLSTALLHSSGAFDSIVVALTSSGVMPMPLAVASIIGAEFGTSVTPFLVSVLGHIRKRERLSVSFTITMSHVIYNLLTLMLFYPTELFFGLFTNIAWKGSSIFLKATFLKTVPDLIELITPWIKPLLIYIPAWSGLVIGAGMLVAALAGVERYMTATFSMPRSWNLLRATFKNPYRAFLAGFIFTIFVPSTTVMVSLLIPLAESGAILADYYILPYILGANIGTVFDVMIAAIATGNPISLGLWLVHLSINIIGAVIFFPLLKPFSVIVRRSAELIAASPKLTLIIVLILHGLPLIILFTYIF